MSLIKKGDAVWVYVGDEECYEKGSVVQCEEGKDIMSVKVSGGSSEVSRSVVLKANAERQDGEVDNTFLRELNEATLLHNVRVRYNGKEDGGCYTVTGHILIAVNPFRPLSIYDEKQIKRYLGRPIGSEPPHIFAVADRMYRLLVSSYESQAIVVSGPSGAGKTETCKLVLKHLAYVTKDVYAKGMSKSSMELGELLVRTNPLLEAFGNAETILNRNSSRFGKFTQIHVSRQGAILGASIQTYLLESTRVVGQAANECNYHIYYQLVYSKDKANYKIEGDPDKYAYLRSALGKSTPRRGGDADEFEVVIDVLTSINVSDEMIDALFQTVSGLLHLGNIKLKENPNGDSVVADMKELATVSKLLCTHEALLQQALCSRTMKLKGSEMQIPLKPLEAMSSRDALAKAVYTKLFGWIVQQINSSLMDTNSKITENGILGILDIYGFENFEKNSLEQLFINFTNEQLHQHFAISLFKTEQEIYASEGIVWPGVDWEDNTECLEVIAGKTPSAIFNQLTEHSRLPKATDGDMTEKLLTDNRKSKYLHPPKLTRGAGGKGQKLTNKEAFVIGHFAGQVIYRTEGWLRKNTDTLHEDLQLCMSSSTSPILAQLFSVGTINAITGGQKGGSKRAGFVADKYVRQLDELMRTLRATQSHFVRCIKPNHKQEPHAFSNRLVLDQLRNSGMVDAVRLLSAGYSTRVPFVSLEKQFKPLCPQRFQNLPASEFCVALLTAFNLSRTDFLLGLTKAFFKAGKLAFVDELMSGAKKLDDAFFKRMTHFLALWRFRRGISAVKCLLFAEAKMRRLRALRKLRYSASIASKVGLSWLRRAKEIRYGVAVTNMQKYGRGLVGRVQRRKREKAIVVAQASSRGYLGRLRREQRKKEVEEERKAKAKADRERKIRERREAMEARERQQTDAAMLMPGAVRGQAVRGGDRLTIGANAAKSTGLSQNRSINYAGRSRAVRGGRDLAGSRMPRGGSGGVAAAMAAGGVDGDDDGEYYDDEDYPEDYVDGDQGAGAADGAEGDVSQKAPAAKASRKKAAPSASAGEGGADEGDLSEGSDLLVQDSDEEDEMLASGVLQGVSEEAGDLDAADIQNPKQLLAATAALNAKNRGSAGAAVPGLKLNTVGGYDADAPAQPGSSTARKTPTMLSRMKNKALGSTTPRNSTLFSNRGKMGDGKRVFLTKTMKGSLVAASMMKVTKSTGMQERFLLVVGDVLFVFLLATQPELPLGLRLWPSQVICLNQSALALPAYKLDVKDVHFTIAARQQALGVVSIMGEDKETTMQFALAMHLGVGNVRRARQQAKLTLAQQLFHEKKLSLLKTQHMIELLHKSQEMFFEAGSGQFDDCNAVCMHSGTMRQSLIDVTPFMPVSDFICEYCSCVIIPEEQATAASEAIETRSEEHKAQLKREQQRKLQLDDETLMVARDVRVLRQRRKVADEEAAAAWKKVQDAIQRRQQLEMRVEELKTLQRLSAMEKTHLEILRGQLVDQVAGAKRQRDALNAQHAIRQARLTGVDTDLDPEEELRRATEKNTAPKASGANTARRGSFGKKPIQALDEKPPAQAQAQAQPRAPAQAQSQQQPQAAEIRDRKASFGKGGSLTRVLSFGKRKEKKASEGAADISDVELKNRGRADSSGSNSLVRKISFGRKK